MSKLFKIKLLQYSWANGEINNIYTLIDDLYTSRDLDNMDDKQVLKLCHNQKYFGVFSTELIKIDFRSIEVAYSDCGFIEFMSKKTGDFLGRLEYTEVVNND